MILRVYILLAFFPIKKKKINEKNKCITENKQVN